jgi:hypothetical protein
LSDEEEAKKRMKGSEHQYFAAAPPAEDGFGVGQGEEALFHHSLEEYVSYCVIGRVATRRQRIVKYRDSSQRS